MGLLGSVLLISPEVLRDILTADDILANGLYVAVGVAWFLTAVTRPRMSWPALGGAMLLLGVALSSRGLYLMLLPLLFFYVLRVTSVRRAVGTMGGVLAVFVAITLPFYLYDPLHFSPLYHTLGKLSLSPCLSGLVVALTMSMSAILGAGIHKRDLPAVFQRMGYLLLLPLLAATIAMAHRGYTWQALDILSHSAASLLFVAIAVALMECQPASFLEVGTLPSKSEADRVMAPN